MQICTNCVMDTTDPDITFNDEGVCNYCQDFQQSVVNYWKPGTKETLKELDTIVRTIKESQKDHEYDAIIGVSGGVDSSYLLHWASKVANLRLLAVHVDAGWNSELAVQNIENLVKKLNIDLYTHVVNWEAMKNVHRAFLQSGVANQDTPQDHAFVGSLYKFVSKHNIKYILNGCNIATESILPKKWGHDAMDGDQIKDICKKFGSTNIKGFPLMSFFKYHAYYPLIKKIEHISPLNYIDYDKERAVDFLAKEYGWRYYGGKHYESRFTKFFQGYWLPQKFGYDKRKAHLSSLILSGQMTRDEALKELSLPSFDEREIKHDIDYIAKKLNFTSDELLSLLNEPNKTFMDYKNNLEKKERFYRWKWNVEVEIPAWWQYNRERTRVRYLKYSDLAQRAIRKAIRLCLLRGSKKNS